MEKLIAWVPQKNLKKYLAEGWRIVEKKVWLHARFSSGKSRVDYVMEKIDETTIRTEFDLEKLE